METSSLMYLIDVDDKPFTEKWRNSKNAIIDKGMLFRGLFMCNKASNEISVEQSFGWS